MKHIKSQITEKPKSKKRIDNERIVKISLLLMLAVFFLHPMNAVAMKNRPIEKKDRFVLHFDDSLFHGHNGNGTTLYLKKALRDQYPGINVTDYRLRKVILVAKSKKGRGRAQLRVGPELTDLYRVDGYSRNFHRDHKKSFDRVAIDTPYYDSRGPWQLFLRGKFKIRKIVLVVDRKERHHYGWTSHEWPRRHEHGWSSNMPPNHHEYNHGLYEGRFYSNMRW